VLILGIDTSGRQGTVALLRVQAGELHLLGLTTISGGQYSELLLSSIAGLLTHHGLQKSDLELIAVASGPGSFTGLRIAIATVKGLAEAFAIPVVAISVLEAIAIASTAQGNVIAAIDAQRSEIFWGEYNLTPDSAAPALAPNSPRHSAEMLGESLATFADFTSRFASTLASPKVFTPDAALAERLRQANVDAVLLAALSAEDFARLAYRKFLAGFRDDVATLDANYLRRSDAELFPALKPSGPPR
jgi:tRNA threonylcarbamoyladenosine biosynthesis protein TsaB